MSLDDFVSLFVLFQLATHPASTPAKAGADNAATVAARTSSLPATSRFRDAF